MKHKPDAIHYATELITVHSNDGLTLVQAQRAALTSIQFFGSYNDSLKQRATNYLRSLVYGEEYAIELHDLEAELRVVGNKLMHDYHNTKLRKQELDLLAKVNELFKKQSAA